MQVRSVDFLLTFKCPARCQHCSYKAGPERVGYMKPKECLQYLKELTSMQPLQSVWIHGGEPFLYFQYLLKIIKKAILLKIPKTGIITNSYWAKNKKTALDKLKQLKSVGLTNLTFSFDAFHQEFIPVEFVKNALRSALEVGFKSISIDTYYVGNLDSNNRFNQSTSKNLNNLGQIEGVEYNKYVMSVEGRGSELTHYLDLKKEIPSGKCPGPHWIEGNLMNPGTIEIDSYGNVTLCPGICIGNTQHITLTEIINNYNYKKHPILSNILEQGPIGLLDLARTHGFELDKKYMNECHLCYDLRKHLQPFFPKFLAPEHCYI